MANDDEIWKGRCSENATILHTYLGSFEAHASPFTPSTFLSNHAFPHSDFGGPPEKPR